MITIVKAPPYLTVQDLGRHGQRAIGVSPGGVLDADTTRVLNHTLDNPETAAVLEWAIAGGTLRADVPLIMAIGGAEVEAEWVRGGVAYVVTPWIPVTLAPGDELHVTRLVRGRFLYVAVRGGIDVPVVAGSRSTHIAAAFGGFAGRRLARGDVLAVGAEPTVRVHAEAVGSSATARSVDTLSDRPIRLMRGPQASLFDAAAWDTLLSETYTVSHASDRMGYRLDGPSLALSGRGEFPSEPTCVGAIQAPPGGAPIVLMHDGPTVGGYPKIAVIHTSDLATFAQRPPGAAVRFTLT